MLAIVTGELVGASELPAAAFPVAVIGLFTCWRNHRDCDSARHSHIQTASHARQLSVFISAYPFISYQALYSKIQVILNHKTTLAIPLLSCTCTESSEKGHWTMSPYNSFDTHMHWKTLRYYSCDQLSQPNCESFWSLEVTGLKLRLCSACKLFYTGGYPNRKATYLQMKYPAVFTCVCPEVGLQVRTLGVGLPAACVGACVSGCPLPRPGAPSSFWLGVQQLQRRGRRGEHASGSRGL